MHTPRMSIRGARRGISLLLGIQSLVAARNFSSRGKIGAPAIGRRHSNKPTTESCLTIQATYNTEDQEYGAEFCKKGSH